MHKWIVVMLVVGFVGISAKAADGEHSNAAPSTEVKTTKTVVEDKTAKLFSLINACMVGTPVATIETSTPSK